MRGGGSTQSSVQPWEARLVARDEVLRGVVVERLEQALRRGDAPAALIDVVPDPVPECRRAHRLAQVVNEVAALDVDDLVVAARRVAVDREVEAGGRAARRTLLREHVAG